ncbi:vesicular glutamate transporter 2-like isoform X2 [Bacillus rossius redtenbacheri]|uniref:vesicular glutamate transporter 2-like isoform X2 n=1 Tax=Bacillus rossius redtenbacheri TaxID=93214 RepID=UPI002FDDD27E
MSCHPDGLGPGWKVWRRRRFVLVLAVFFGQVVKMILRVNMSIAVVDMTEERPVPSDNGTTVQAREFDWDAGTRGLLLSSFFYGFLLTQLAGGVLATRLGAARLFGLGVLVASAVTLLSPAAARVHLRCLLALRFFEGLCEGLLGPSVQLLWARWIPLQERNRVVGFSFSGNSWGYVVGFSLSSLISEKLGWPSIFYFSGAAGILWFAVWWAVVEEYPENDRHVSPPELAYIKQSLGSWENHSKQVAPVPYCRILASLPVWAFVLPAMAEAWFTQNMITQLPAFLRDVLRTDVQNLGLLSSVQHAVMVAVLYALAPVADALTSRNILSITTVRKLYMCGFLALAGGAMALTGFLRSKAAIIASLSVAQSSVALVWNTVLRQRNGSWCSASPRR